MRTKSTTLLRTGCLVLFLFVSSFQGVAATARDRFPLNAGQPARGIGPGDIAVIVNDSDPLSRRIGEYYKVRRNIPPANIIHVRFRPGAPVMSRTEFQRIKAVVDLQTPPSVQAYALTWAAPYRVACMSITTAFAAGFDSAFCASGCRPTKYDSYFDSSSRKPYMDFRIRPTMALAGLDFAEVKALIDRGVAADGTFPRGTGYLVSTSDKNRNARADLFPMLVGQFGKKIRLRIVKADYIQNRKDVLFYFTGVPNVEALQTDRFLPGAIADHLTSAGGRLIDSPQMSSLAWLRAGATASYGAVTESCNIADKFPSPGIVIRKYLEGETLIEAYWKSVAMPGQGIFIGEPLASPFALRTTN